MPSSMYDINNNLITHRDLQNRSEWYAHGIRKEFVFIERFGNTLGLGINPDKNHDVTAPDLINLRTLGLGDLKCQNTPFFTSFKYGLDPQYTVTFNRNDAERYRVLYPHLDIYFWIDWIAVKYTSNYNFTNNDIIVSPMHGVWKISFENLDKLLSTARLHSYLQRRNDNQNNARDSYLININHYFFEKVI